MATEGLRFVISSHARFKILMSLAHKASTPTELATSTEKHLSHISRALRELEGKNLVECSDPRNTKPRVYALTQQGAILVREAQRYQTRLRLT